MRKFFDQNFQGDTILQTHRGLGTDDIHQSPDRTSFLRHTDEELARRTIFKQADGDIPFVAPHAELVSQRMTRGRKSATSGSIVRRTTLLPIPFLGCRQRLALLGTITVNRQSLQPESPPFEIGLFNIVNGTVRRHVDRLGNGTRQEWLGCRHHLDVSLPLDRASSIHRLESTVEDCEMIGLQVRSTLDRFRLFNVLDDPVDLGDFVAQCLQSQWNRPVDDLHHATTRQLLVLDQSNIGFNPCRVTVHHEGNGSGRSQHGGLSVAVTILTTGIDTFVPDFPGGIPQVIRTRGIDPIYRIPMHPHHSQHRVGVILVPGEGAKISGNPA